MMKRRAFMVASAHGGLLLALAAGTGDTRAQRPANPIARPPRPGGVLGPGRFPAYDGTSRAPVLGVFIVRAVSERDNMVQLSDADGRTAGVLVPPEVFDLSELKPGDEIAVDFVIPESKDAHLKAAGVWRK
jgi:hypothetical protein